MRASMIVVVFVVLGMPAGVLADVMSPEHVQSLRAPESCPAGATAIAGSHGDTGRSPYCSPTTCRDDSGCAGGTGPCRAIALCVRQQPTYGPPRPDGQPDTYGIASGDCGAGDACEQGTCETAMRCAGAGGGTAGAGGGSTATPAPSPTSTPTSGPAASRGCACAVGARAERGLIGTAFAMGLLACFVAVRRARRRG